MLTLTIMRHGKAEPHLGPDFDRKLAPKGVRRSRLVAEMLSQAGVTWDLVVTSPADRAAQTAAEVSAIVPVVAAPVTDRDIYDHTAPEALLAALQRHASGARNVALFGHNPGLSFLAHWLCPDFVDNLGTSAAVVLDLDGSDWCAVTPASASLRLQCRPHDHPDA